MSCCHIVTQFACHIITLCALYKHHHSHNDNALTISLDDGNDDDDFNADGDENADNNDERSLITMLMTLMMTMTVTEMTVVEVHLKKALQPSQT